MSNYRRLISYIYAYEGGTKGKNIGFAKIEIRNGQCRIHVNVKKIFLGGSDIGVYLLSPNREILLGRIFIRNGAGEFRVNVSAGNVEGSGCSMEQCYGLTIHETENTWRTYTTIWEDAVAQAAEVELAHVTSEKMRAQTIPEPRPSVSEEIQKELEQEEEWQDKEPREEQREITRESLAERQEKDWEKEKEKGAKERDEEKSVEERQEESQGEKHKTEENQDGLKETREERGEERREESPERTWKDIQENISGEYGNESVEEQSGKKPEEQMEEKSEEKPIEKPEEQPTEKPEGQSAEGITKRPERKQEPLKPEKDTIEIHKTLPEQPDGKTEGETQDENKKREERAETKNSGNRAEEPADEIQGQVQESPDESGWIGDSPAQRRSPAERLLEQIMTERIPADDNNGEENAGQNRVQERVIKFAKAFMQGKSPGTNMFPRQQTVPQEVSAAPRQAAVVETTPRPLPEPGDPARLKELDRQEREEAVRGTLWGQLQSKYPKVLAFDYVHDCEILMIKPQDIGILPRENWMYGNNSFLLHGYYNYRHLILARLENPGGEPRYLLGVPGHYFSNEKNLASMFGFPHFVLAKKQPEQDGRFGYWYTDLRL